MQNKNIWIFIVIALVSVMLIGNRKVRLGAVLKEQLYVFRNAKKGNISAFDCCCFWFFLGLFRAFVYVNWILRSKKHWQSY